MPTGFDWNSDYRMPPGWTDYPDGSIGPASGLPDWLKQLIPSPGASQPYGPSGYPDNLPNRPYGPPGGGLMGIPGASPGGPSMGFPAQGGPQVIPPQHSPIPPMKSVGPFTGGASTENMPGGDATGWNVGFNAGGGGGGGGDGAGINPLTLLGAGNPYWRAAIAASSIMAPTPAETGELPLSMSGARPMHPASTGAMPRAPYDPLSSIRAPAPPSRGGSGYGGVPPAGWGEKSPPLPPPRPTAASPAQTPRPGAAPASPAQSDRFVRIDRVNAGPLAAQPGRGYQTALNLADLFRRRA
jgi:hypothetical protein